ncbi:hypothetical protein CEV31_4279 [Brucella thiophenivorans]|uniref:Uncharacterized protein n=2 Tax=Brucella thiophenivorans TaxID=571255 RepID=A0A256FTS7_9HYPH|nr:hypothetical protein CEV31_4279 [Brucella thiophenivorans]
MEKVMFLIDDDLDNIITAAMNSDSLYIPEFKGLYDLSSFTEAAKMAFKCSKLHN